MTAPVFTALPPFPSRVGDPDNFLAEVVAFLNKQDEFVIEANSVRDYLNALLVDTFNWGIVGSTNPIRETVMPFPDAPVMGDQALEFASEADATFEALFNFIADANAANVYIDTLATASDYLGPVVDELRPTVLTVPPTPMQSDSQAMFESKAFAFYSALKPYGGSVGAFADWLYMRLIEEDDYGIVGDSDIVTIDYGVITL